MQDDARIQVYSRVTHIPYYIIMKYLECHINKLVPNISDGSLRREAYGGIRIQEVKVKTRLKGRNRYWDFSRYTRRWHPTFHHWS